MKLLIIFLAVFYGSRLGSSVPQKKCFCSDHTETDHRGQQIGKCQTKFSGKNWCYIQSNSNCPDKKKSKRGHNLFWSHVACQRNPITPPSSVKKVLWLGPNPWTTLTLPDFAPAPSECSIPEPGNYEESDYNKDGVHFLFQGGATAHTQVIEGTLYECDGYSCKSYDDDGNQWKLEDPQKMNFPHKQTRTYAASALIPGPQQKWIIHGGYHAPHPLVWTPGAAAGNWKQDRNIRSPDPVDLHCIVFINGKILQVGGRSKSGYSKRVFLGDVEVASMKGDRHYHTCAFFNDKTWVAGGSDKYPGSVEVYDHTTDTWTDGPAIPTEVLDGTPKLMVIQGDLYYIGGGSVGKVFRLGDGTWDEVADIPKGSKFIAQILEKTC